MVDTINTAVRQESYSLDGEGAAGHIRLNRRGELVIVPVELQWALDGRVFNASNAVQETDEAFAETGRGTANINPSLLVDVPSGKTIIPLEVIIDLGNTPGTSVDMNFTINTDDATRYSSGGAAITPINMRKDDPRASACPVYSGSTQIVASANTDDDTIFNLMVEAEATPRTAVAGLPLVNWTSKLYVPPVLVGPASLLVFMMSASTNDQEMYWSIKWAEFDTTEVVA